MAGQSRGVIAAGFDPREEFLYETGRSVPWNVVEAKIHHDVKFIPNGLFKGCARLESLTLHDDLTGIGDESFMNCWSLRTLRCYPAVRKIGKRAFLGCWRLSEFKPSLGLKEIEEYTFSGCSSLQTIRIPSTVTKICAYAFSSCSRLGSAELSEGLRTIENSAFRDCWSLGSILIPRTVESVGSRAFMECRNLSSVQLHEDLEKIDKDAFVACPLAKAWANVRFVRLSERREAILMDARAESMFEGKLNGIANAMAQGVFDWNECTESLRQAHDVLGHWEKLNEAAATLELAQWKNKIQEDEGGGRTDVNDDNPGTQNPNHVMRVACGASIVTKQALKFLAHSKTWE